MTPLDEREWAGRELATLLEGLRAEDPVVFGIARGGVPVAAALAQALGAPLEVLVVRKLRTGGRRGSTLGAVAENGSLAMNESGGEARRLQRIALRAMSECVQLASRYHGGNGFPLVRGRTAILVDDALSTGATVRAAVRLLRSAGAGRIVVAVPCALSAAAERVRSEVDDLVALEVLAAREPLRGSYWSFGEIGDEAVQACLRQYSVSRPAASGGPARAGAVP